MVCLQTREYPITLNLTALSKLTRHPCRQNDPMSRIPQLHREPGREVALMEGLVKWQKHKAPNPLVEASNSLLLNSYTGIILLPPSNKVVLLQATSLLLGLLGGRERFLQTDNNRRTKQLSTFGDMTCGVWLGKGSKTCVMFELEIVGVNFR